MGIKDMVKKYTYINPDHKAAALGYAKQGYGALKNAANNYNENTKHVAPPRKAQPRRPQQKIVYVERQRYDDGVRYVRAPVKKKARKVAAPRSSMGFSGMGSGMFIGKRTW